MGVRSGDTHINRELRVLKGIKIFLKVSRYNPVSFHNKKDMDEKR